MHRERITVSLDPVVAARVRQCGATQRGGASAYLERLVRNELLAEAVRDHGRWLRQHPGFLEHVIAETETALTDRPAS